ncbi:MAG: glycoside hydrolase family 3 C-terminal domain-containing protein [Eubacteriales bacterium]
MNFIEALDLTEKDNSVDNRAKLANELIKQMSLQEKLYMIGGHHNRLRDIVKHGRTYNAEPVEASGCERLKIPMVKFADGPRGVVPGNCTCFPVPMARGASFDVELENRIGEAIGCEVTAQGANFFGGVCINLLRHPAWGRAQETYGEDMHLLGRMGAALTQGVQKNGVMACVKHFALNSIENLRFKVNPSCDDRTLREIYLPHFKACVDAGAASVMGAYNKVNGEYSCQNKRLLTDILKNEWGFNGFVISDFTFGVRDGFKAIKSGLDLEMPTTRHYGKELAVGLKNGEVAEKDIDKALQSIIATMLKFQAVQKKHPYSKSVVSCKEHTDLAREAAEKSAVLIKNDNILPLDKTKIKSLAIVGRYADTVNVGDKGSSAVYAKYVVTPYQGFKAYCGDEIKVVKEQDNKNAIETAKKADVVIVCVGLDFRNEGENAVNFDYKVGLSFGGDRETLRINKADSDLIKKLSEVNEYIIVCLTCGSAVIIEEWKDYAKGILFSWYNGMEGGNALARLAFGDVNPSGKLPFTIAKDESEYPPFLYKKDDKLDIEYDYYHGYLLFDKKGLTPAYPFGFGLSYTSFGYSDLTASFADDKKNINIAFSLENTGNRSGSEVSQLYFGSTSKTLDRPKKLLKAFTKTELAPNEKRVINLQVAVNDLMFYNTEKSKYELDKEYKVFVSGNGKDFLETNILM